MKVWTVSYYATGNAIDVSVFATKELAEEDVKDFILDQLDNGAIEDDDVCEDIRSDIAQDNIFGAQIKFNDYNANAAEELDLQFIYLEEQEIKGFNSTLDALVEHEIKHKAFQLFGKRGEIKGDIHPGEKWIPNTVYGAGQILIPTKPDEPKIDFDAYNGIKKTRRY